MTIEEELIFILDEIEAMTRRSPLETGFNHSNETMRELQQRLKDISAYCQSIKPIITRILKKT